jgi:hypothetical protein
MLPGCFGGLNKIHLSMGQMSQNAGVSGDFCYLKPRDGGRMLPDNREMVAECYLENREMVAVKP